MNFKNVILIGYMGSGKTTVGQLLAQKVFYTFIDTDRAIEKRNNATCRQIIENRSEEYFRQLEHNLLLEFEPIFRSTTIISTGGGMACSDENMALLKKMGTTVYLKWSAEDLVTRLMLTNLSTRPLLKDFSQRQLWSYVRQDLPKRETFYSQADITINAPLSSLSAHSDQEIADYIIDNIIFNNNDNQ